MRSVREERTDRLLIYHERHALAVLLRAEIQRLRQTTRRAPDPPIPTAQRASDASLLARLQTATDRNRTLSEDNQRLRRQLAQALGEQRTAPRRPTPTSHDQAHHLSSATIEPC